MDENCESSIKEARKEKDNRVLCVLGRLPADEARWEPEENL